MSLEFWKVLFRIFFFIFLILFRLSIFIPFSFNLFRLKLNRFWFCIVKDCLCIFISSWESIKHKSSVLAVIVIQSSLNQFTKIRAWESFMFMFFLPNFTFLYNFKIWI